MHTDDGQARRGSGAGHQAFQAPRSFQHHQGGGEDLEAGAGRHREDLVDDLLDGLERDGVAAPVAVGNADAREQNLHKARGQGEAARAAALKAARIESGAALGFIGAIGACGGYLIPSGFGKSIAMTGGPSLALAIYLAFYASCLGLTWWFYLRRGPQSEGAPSLAEARV